MNASHPIVSTLVLGLPFALLSCATGGSESVPDARLSPNLPAESRDAAEPDAGPSAQWDAKADDAEAEAPVAVDIGPFDEVPGVLVYTLAGAGTAGSTDAVGAEARFHNPSGIAIDDKGNVLVTEYDGARVRRIDMNGAVTTIGAATNFKQSYALTFGPAGIFVQTDHSPTGAKDATSGTIWRVQPKADGTPAPPEVVVVGLGRPRGLAVLADGRIVVTDRMRHVVSLFDSVSRTLTHLAGLANTAGFSDAQGSLARFDNPYGPAVLPDGSIIVADTGNHRLRRITVDGFVTTYAGNGIEQSRDGPRLTAGFRRPIDVAVDAAGVVYVSDPGARRIRRITAEGLVQTVAGDGASGYQDGIGRSARFYGQEGIEVQKDGKVVFVADGNSGDGSPYHRVRRIVIP